VVRREIELDEETDRILAELAQSHDGNPGKALADLIHAHESLEAFVEQCEEAHKGSLNAQLERAKNDFRGGRFTTWDEVRRRNHL
jgi:hypothetical protein